MNGFVVLSHGSNKPIEVAPRPEPVSTVTRGFRAEASGTMNFLDAARLDITIWLKLDERVFVAMGRPRSVKVDVDAATRTLRIQGCKENEGKKVFDGGQISIGSLLQDMNVKAGVLQSVSVTPDRVLILSFEENQASEVKPQIEAPVQVKPEIELETPEVSPIRYGLNISNKGSAYVSVDARGFLSPKNAPSLGVLVYWNPKTREIALRGGQLQDAGLCRWSGGGIERNGIFSHGAFFKGKRLLGERLHGYVVGDALIFSATGRAQSSDLSGFELQTRAYGEAASATFSMDGRLIFTKKAVEMIFSGYSRQHSRVNVYFNPQTKEIALEPVMPATDEQQKSYSFDFFHRRITAVAPHRAMGLREDTYYNLNPRDGIMVLTPITQGKQ